MYDRRARFVEARESLSYASAPLSRGRSQNYGSFLQRNRSCLAAGASLQRAGTRRGRITQWVAVLAKKVGWMNALPVHYPELDMLRARFDAAGVEGEFIPLHGNTPFNNWRIVATRR